MRRRVSREIGADQEFLASLLKETDVSYNVLMHFGVVGGVERNAHHYAAAARAFGHSVECHGGHLEGTGHGSLENLVLRSDVVVLVTEVNSHAAVWAARELSRRHGRELVLVRKLGVSRLREILSQKTLPVPKSA